MKKSVFFVVFTVALGLFTVDWLFAETTGTEVASTTELTFLTLFFSPRSFSCTRFFSIPRIFLTGPCWVD